MSDIAKEFEDRFKKDWGKIPGSFAYRLKDQQTRYFGANSNPCDFICYKYPYIYMIECKTHSKNTLNFSDFPQYGELSTYKGIPGMIVGTIIWFYDHDQIVFVPIGTWDKLRKEGKKSFHVDYIGKDDYPNLPIPSIKLVKYMNSDYSLLQEKASLYSIT